MEIVATLVENTFDGQMEIGLVQIGGRPVLETGPDTRVVFEFGVYPDFGTAVSVEGRIIEEIFFDECVFVFAFFKWGFEFGRYIRCDCDQRQGKYIQGNIFLIE
jgi:hypothetical protein